MLRFLVRELLPPPFPEATPADPVDCLAERIRHVPGVSVVWWYGQGPFFACARHCGERHVASARTLVDALRQLEEDVRATNRETVREAFRLL
jgi:hypothetical protein